MKNFNAKLKKEVEKELEKLEKYTSRMQLYQDALKKALFPGILDKTIKVSQVDFGIQDIDVHIPYNIPLIHETIDIFNKKGWSSYAKWEKGIDQFSMSHKKTPIKIWFFLKTDMDGATCKRVKIDEKVIEQTVSVYEYVCNEGAEENVFET